MQRPVFVARERELGQLDGFLNRVPPDIFSHLAGQLVEVTDRVSRQLGYVRT